MSTFSPIRACILLAVVALGLTAMSGRVAYLQTVGRDRTLHSAERQQYQQEMLEARRGNIFDTNLIVMAGTVQKQRLFIDPKYFEEAQSPEGRKSFDKRKLLEKLGEIIERDPAELAAIIHDHSLGQEPSWAERLAADDANNIPRKPGKDRYLILAEALGDREVEEIEKLNVPGIGFEATSQRCYPMASKASHILGAVGKDDTGRGQRGLEGLELKFNSTLAGVDGWKRTLKNARRNAIGVADDDYLPPRHGQHLVLTIDANIQMIAEQELAAVCESEKIKAKRGEVIVMDPTTGDVLAMANWPTFNPQNIEDSPPELRRNRCLTDPAEFGSVIKPFIAGPAFAWHQTRPEEVWNIPGITYLTPYGRRITDVHGYGKLAMWDVLVKSSNIGMSMLGERMGNPLLHKALSSFRFGEATGIELPGEADGRLNPLAKWSHFTTESVSQGYELMVTPIQLARAFCTYANGGKLVPVHVIKGTLDADGTIAERRNKVRLEELPQVIPAETAMEMRRILADVPIRGTAKGTASQYWNIFGKTGTAHISEGKAGYRATRYNSSFICGAPFENPKLVVAMLIHEPQTAVHYGGAVAAPAASRVMDRALSYLQTPNSPELDVPPANVASVLFAYNPNEYKRHEEKVQASARD